MQMEYVILWEVGPTLTPAGQGIGTGNVALIKCPQKTGGAFIDVVVELQLLTVTT